MKTYVSLFSSAGVGDYGFYQAGFKLIASNELLQRRMDVQLANNIAEDRDAYIVGDITKKEVKDKITKQVKKYTTDLDLLVATPPCQGMSTLGKREYISDKRNSLVHYVLKAIDNMQPDYVLIENVPKFIELQYNSDGTTFDSERVDGKSYRIVDLLEHLYAEDYSIEMKILNAMNYGVP